MSLPEYIEALNAPTGGNVPYGILHQIRGNVTNDKIVNYVVPKTSGTTYGNKNIPIMLSSNYWHSYETTGYYQIEFKERTVFPTHYSFKGYEAAYSKEWNLYGFNYENEDYTLLSSDTSVGSTYCGSGSSCASIGWGTFKIKNTPQKAFRYFRSSYI